MIQVVVLGLWDVLFEGAVPRVVLPGEAGVFEVWPSHRPLISRLLPGVITAGDQRLAIRRGVARVFRDTVTAFVEPEDS